MKRVILHVGAGKTGTSALQVAFAKNRDRLKAAGILYPDLVDLAPAESEKITSGNAPLLAFALGYPCNETQKKAGLRALESFHEIIKESEKPVIFCSSEVLQSLKAERLAELKRFCESNGRSLQLVFFVRNIGDYLVSVYLQFVKRLGETREFEDWVRTHKQCPFSQTIQQALEVSAGDSIIRVLNYEEHAEDLVRYFFKDMLGVKDLQGFDFETGRINRSIGEQELRFMLMLNRLCDSQTGMYFSDNLIYAAPNSRATIAVSKSARSWVENHFRSHLEFVNRHVEGRPVTIGLSEGERAETESVENYLQVAAVGLKFLDDRFRENQRRLDALGQAVNELNRKLDAETARLSAAVPNDPSTRTSPLFRVSSTLRRIAAAFRRATGSGGTDF